MASAGRTGGDEGPGPLPFHDPGQVEQEAVVVVAADELHAHRQAVERLDRQQHVLLRRRHSDEREHRRAGVLAAGDGGEPLEHRLPELGDLGQLGERAGQHYVGVQARGEQVLAAGRAHERAEAAAEAEAEAQSGRNACISMDCLRCRTATTERHRSMVIERGAQRERFVAREIDGEAGPSEVQGEHGGDGDVE